MQGLIHVLAGWGQVNFVVPPQSAPGPAEVAVVRADRSIATGSAIIADIAPGLSGKDGNGRGPVIGQVLQRFPDGHRKSFEAGSCDSSHCWTNPIHLSKGVTTVVRLVGNGLRYVRSRSDIDVRAGGIRLPVLSYGPGPDPGLDQVIVKLTAELRGLGESDLIVSASGRVSNVVRIRTE